MLAYRLGAARYDERLGLPVRDLTWVLPGEKDKGFDLWVAPERPTVRVLQEYVPRDGRSGELPGLVRAKWSNPPNCPEHYYHLDITFGNPLDTETGWRLTTYPRPGAVCVEAQTVRTDYDGCERWSSKRSITVFVTGTPPAYPDPNYMVRLDRYEGWWLHLPYTSDLREAKAKLAKLQALR